MRPEHACTHLNTSQYICINIIEPEDQVASLRLRRHSAQKLHNYSQYIY